MAAQIASTDELQDIPPFPTDVPIAPLVALSLAKLRDDTTINESDRLFAASKELGFFYLDMRGDVNGETMLSESSKLFGVEEKLFELGREELSKYDYSGTTYFGYKGFGAFVDDDGRLDWNEFYNAGKDDFLGNSKMPYAHPQWLHENGELLRSYMRNAHKLIALILTRLTTHLGLPPDTLTDLHRQNAISGDHIRFVKSPPQPPDDLRNSMGQHTDFGSITILFNRVGGLQVLPPGSSEWCYVKPLPGHCIVNLGDAMVKFTNGLLRSNLHRVVAPPGEQVKCTRYSLVYFGRPEDEVKLKRLEGSSVIPPLPEGTVEEVVYSKDHIRGKATARRVEVLAAAGEKLAPQGEAHHSQAVAMAS